MQHRLTRSKIELRGPENGIEFRPRRPRPRVSASFRALNPMATTKRAGGRAGGAFLGGLGGWSHPGETYN
eukprot:5704143-Alexandrium_andersonii.AAC.1